MQLPTFLLALASLASATHLRLLIPSSTALPHPTTQLPPSTHATLKTLGHIHRAPLTTSSSFDFSNVTTGSYLLDVHSHAFSFRPLRVDVHVVKEGAAAGAGAEDVEVFGTWRGNEWSNKGEKVEIKSSIEGPLGVKYVVYSFEGRVEGPKEYLVERAGFSPLSLLKNPMILIAGVSMLIVFGMPYLMDNMDPELKAEFEERQKTHTVTSASAANLQNFDAAAWLAGTSTKKNVPAASERAPVDKGVTR